MKQKNITTMFIILNILFRTVISLIILCLKSYAKILFYNYGTSAEYFQDIISFMLTTNLPVMIVLAVVFYFYWKPLEKFINKINNNEPVSQEVLEKASYTIRYFSAYMIIFTIAGSLVGQFYTIISSGLINSFFETREFSWTIFMIASALLYSFGHITITNQLLSESRKLLNLYHKEKKRGKIGLRIKNIMLFLFLLLFSFSFFMRFASLYLDKENFYSDLMENVIEKKLTLPEAEYNYKNYLHSLMDPGKDKEDIISQIRFPYQDQGARFSGYLLFFIVSFISLIVIGFIIVFLFSRELTMQIKNQRLTIKDILSGKEDLSKRISIIQYDEVGDLSEMINTLMDKLKEILFQIKDSSITVSSSSDSLNERLLNTSSAVEEMVASIQEITKNINNQMNVVENTKEKLEIMLSGIDKISTHIEGQVSFIEETSSAMQEMARNITSVNTTTTEASGLSNNLIKIAKEGDVSVKNTIEAIKKIDDASNHVLDIVGILDNLSSRTDLLAINTAIEAAHAGKYGRGFAIIADEIRKLSENSEVQTKEIIHYIKDMYSRVQNGVLMSEKAGISFKNIDRDIEKTSNLIEQINYAMNEQSAGTNEILSSVDSIVSTSIEVKNIAVDLKKQSQTISNYMKDLFTVSNHIDNATKEQENGNKEILSLITNVKEISIKNIDVVNKLKAIVNAFNIDMKL